MASDLKGKKAVVTGSTSGIGLGIARTLAAHGCDIMLNGFGDAAAIEQIRSGLASTCGVAVGYCDADMSRPEAVRGLIDVATDTLGQVDILVGNAGIQHVDAVEDFPIERWDAVIAINLSAVFHGIAAVLPQMRRRNWGRIINIASAHGLVASTHKAAYVASKHGVVGLTKVVALETAETGITSNAICPGWVLTPLVQQQIDARAERKRLSPDAAKVDLLSEKQPSKEFVTPEQLGAMTAFLSSEAASQITGQSMVMDGGWTAQ